MGYSGRIIAVGFKNAVDYISKAETVPALLYPTLSLIARTKSSKVTSHQENALWHTLRFAEGTICSHQEGAPLLYGSTKCLYTRDHDTLEHTST